MLTHFQEHLSRVPAGLGGSGQGLFSPAASTGPAPASSVAPYIGRRPPANHGGLGDLRYETFYFRSALSNQKSKTRNQSSKMENPLPPDQPARGSVRSRTGTVVRFPKVVRNRVNLLLEKLNLM
jgi:hypothetical protein